MDKTYEGVRLVMLKKVIYIYIYKTHNIFYSIKASLGGRRNKLRVLKLFIFIYIRNNSQFN